MHQPTLFPTAPNAYGESAPIMVRAHNADPVTSHESAARVAKSGKVQRHRQIALELVKRFPGKTGHELFAIASAAQRDELENHFELYRRLADLKNACVVVQGPPRACMVKRTRMVTWFATDHGPGGGGGEPAVAAA